MEEFKEKTLNEQNEALLEWYLTLCAPTLLLDAHTAFRYGKLSVRRVDLVGDYAGQELFLLEGDSLLLRCFSDPDLDFDRKLQVLYS